jgi:hypothetical protein
MRVKIARVLRKWADLIDSPIAGKWCTDNLHRFDHGSEIDSIIYGPTGMGKTKYIFNPLPIPEPNSNPATDRKI